MSHRSLSIILAVKLLSVAGAGAVEVFTQAREEPFKFLLDSVPASAAEGKASFSGTARPGEFYVFQIGLKSDVKTAPLGIKFGELAGSESNIDPDRMRCLSLGGIGYDGEPFTKEISLSPDQVQILWCGIEVPKEAKGSFKGTTKLFAGEKAIASVDIQLQVEGDIVEDYGVNKGKNLNRLMWLDSKVGWKDTVTRPYIPIEVEGSRIRVLGRELVVGENGLPKEILSFFKPNNSEIIDTSVPVIAKPFSFEIETGSGVLQAGGELSEITHSDIEASWTSTKSNSEFKTEVIGKLDYTGSGQLTIKITALKDVSVTNMKLNGSWSKNASDYFVGIGERGSKSKEIDWKWDKNKYQNSLWLGDINAGLMMLFKDETYREPLVNIYYHYGPPAYSPTWANGDLGGVKITKNDNTQGMDLEAYTGQRTVKKGETLQFMTDFYVTPFKTIDHKKHWNIRNYHPQSGHTKGYHADQIKNFLAKEKHTANILTVHQSKYENPYINYPYSDDNVADLKEVIDVGHKHGIRVRPYYTTRELSNNIPEIIPLHSMNQEILMSPGKAKVDSQVEWYNDNLGGHYYAAWQNPLAPRENGVKFDNSILTMPYSRWDNFYLAGLDWMVRTQKIDGIYIDDTALAATSMRRARHIVDQRPGSIIDFHTWKFFRPEVGFAHNILIYTKHMPYIDKLWIGEEHYPDQEPLDTFLVEMSGIPFGLTSEMLHGADPGKWRGMVFSETGRLGWAGDPRPIWETLLPLGIEDTEFFLYEAENCPAKSSHATIPVSVFKGEKRSFISIASWDPESQDVMLDIDWDALGLDKTKVTLYAPKIKDFQVEATWDVGQPISVDPLRGYVIILEEKEREKIATASDALDSLVLSIHEQFSTPKLDPRWTIHKTETATVNATGNQLSLKGPANGHLGLECAIPKKTKSISAEITIGSDTGKSWGPALAMVSDKNEVLRYGLRSEGDSYTYFIVVNGREHAYPAIQGSKRDLPATLQLSLDETNIYFTVKAPKKMQLIHQVTREGFSGDPVTLRVGKVSRDGTWADYGGPEGLGDMGESKMSNVKIYTN